MKLPVKLTSRRCGFSTKSILAVVIVEILLLTIVFIPSLPIKFDGEIGITAFTAIPLFLITILQLSRTHRLQKADFVKDYFSQFSTIPDLSATFHDLIYAYHDDIFDEMDRIVREKNIKRTNEPIFPEIDGLEQRNLEGYRFYHPQLFQYSEEEKRLDRLLGYFDIIGYYYAKQLIDIVDIAGILGYQLGIINDRKVIKKYMELCENEWQKLPYQKSSGTPAPFEYLRKLLYDLEAYNKSINDKVKAIKSQYI